MLCIEKPKVGKALGIFKKNKTCNGQFKGANLSFFFNFQTISSINF